MYRKGLAFLAITTLSVALWMGPVLANTGIGIGTGTGTGTTTAPITAEDTTAPVVTAPANITVEAEGPGGTLAANAAIAAFLAAATGFDDVDGSLAVVNDAPAEFPFGVTTVTFSATDAVGNTGTAQATVTVQDTLAPTVIITNPAEGDIVSGPAVLITAEAADAGSGVALVEFSIDGGPFSPLAFNGITGKYEEPSWNTDNLTDGPHTIDVRATDAAVNIGVRATDATVNIGVATQVSVTVDNTGPTVTITSPAAGSNVSGTISVTADATSDVAQVEFFVDGVSIGADDTAPYAVSLDTTSLAEGVITIGAKATDSVGRTTAAASVSVTVDNTAPVITLVGADPVSVELGTVYADAGATALDNLDGDITAGIVTVNPVDTAALGSYTVTYDVMDSAGNPAAQVTRTVNVMDTTDAPKLTVNKIVVNNDGGTLKIIDFQLLVDGNPVTSGEQNNLSVGVRVVSETGQAGYSGTIGGDCAANGSIILALGDVKSCTITNDDIAPTLKLVKVVTNDNSGIALPNDWDLTATGSGGFTETTPDGANATATAVNAGVDYVLSETGPSGYIAGFWSCDVGSLSGSTVTLAPGDAATCTIINDDIAANLPALTVIKTVVNDDGGSAAAGDWTMHINGSNVSSTSFAGSETGVTITLDAGTYSVSESGGPSGYAMSFSTDCSGTITAGDVLTCTITNNDIAPKLTVTKTVVNDDGGTKAVGDFPLFVDGNPVISGVQNTLLAGTHTASEDDPSPGYAASAWGGDCAADGSITLAPGDVKTCTITNNDVGATLTVTVIRHKGRPVTETFSVSKDMNAIIVMNGTTGLKNLRIEINGRKFQVAGLKDGEVRTLDISSAMIGEGNAITLTGLGKPGTKATVKIWHGGG